MAAKKEKKAKRKAEPADDADGEQQEQQQQHAAAAAAAAAEAPGGKKAKKQKQKQQQQQQQQGAGDAAAAIAAAEAEERRRRFPNGRRFTVTMAVPGSIIDNTQSAELANFVAGQVARTAAVFNVDELVIIDDTPQRKDGTVGAGAAFLARVCQYLETPQYLRKALVPMHPDLRLAVRVGGCFVCLAPERGAFLYLSLFPASAALLARPPPPSTTNRGDATHTTTTAPATAIPPPKKKQTQGLLPPLDAPHHLRASEWRPFREGVVLKAEPGRGSFVDVGLDRTALVKGPGLLRPGARVTLRLGAAPRVEFVEGYGESMLLGEVAPPSAPREEEGLYWGYATRLAKGVSGLIRECPFEGGYDLKVGTSERGQVRGCAL